MLTLALGLTGLVSAYVAVVQDEDGSRFISITKRAPYRVPGEESHGSIWQAVSSETSPLDGFIRDPQEDLVKRNNEGLVGDTSKFSLSITGGTADTTVHPQIQHQQELNRLAKRHNFERPSDAIVRHLDDLQRRNVGSGLYKRANRMNVLESRPAVRAGEVSVDQDGRDVSYFSTIRLGSKREPFRVVMDTGSGDLWVPANDCQDKACLNHKTFGPEDSETFKLSPADWKITYGSGAAMGNLVQDSMEIAGLSLGPVTFGTASRLTKSFANFPADGILGLGSYNASTQKIPTTMDNLVTAGLLKRKLFGVNLNRASDNSRDGLITFGSIDVSKFSGPLITVPNVATSGLWEATVDAIAVETVELSLMANTTAIIDTGTTLLIMPPAMATSLHAAIPNAQTDTQGTFAIPCSTNLRLSLTFGGQPFFIRPVDYVGHKLNDVNSKQPLCLSKISGQTIKGPKKLLVGDVFLKNVYSVYDFDKNEIGFGTK